jgi:hypothetical protein
LAAAGAMFIARKILAPKAELIFFAMFLIMIARVLPGFHGLLRSGDGVAAGNGCRRGVCRDRPAGRAPTLRPDCRISSARAMGPAARTSGLGQSPLSSAPQRGVKDLEVQQRVPNAASAQKPGTWFLSVGMRGHPRA